MTAPRRPLESLDFSVLQQCMHCGLCLPVCPTFAETGRERNSPRGRIALMRAVAEKERPVTKAFTEEMDYCLGCLACTTACPAGVDYGTLIESARATGESLPQRRSFFARGVRWFFLRQVFRRPTMLRTLARVLRAYQTSQYRRWLRRRVLPHLLPVSWQRLEGQAPRVSTKFSNELIPPLETPLPKRHRVALLTGCVQDVLYAEVNRATADVLLANGCEVITPPSQGCCGSLHAHNGDLATARALARRMLDLIRPEEVDGIISNAAGCGSHLKHYGPLLADDASYRERAVAWDRKMFDVSEFLIHIGFRTPLAPAAGARRQVVTYHDACHLCHGQGVVRQPRDVLRACPGVELRECAESTWCCGSAGVYALSHPATANQLRDRKWKNLGATQAEIVALANPGCALHLAAREGETRPRIVHPVELLAEAYANESPPP